MKRIIIGAGNTSYEGWISTQENELNLLKIDDYYKLFEKAGFKVDLLEYCDENGRFHFNYWNPEQGIIGRSLRFDTRNNDGKLGMVSIIIDAYKEYRYYN